MKRAISFFIFLVCFCGTNVISGVETIGDTLSQPKEEGSRPVVVETKVDNGLTGTFVEGKIDGKRTAGGTTEIILGTGAGVLGGCCLGSLYPLFLVSGEPPFTVMDKMKDKTPEYKDGFLKGYKSKKTTSAWTGVVTGALVFATVYTIINKDK